MNITRLAITNNRTTLLLLLVILFLGMSSFKEMPKDYDPGFIIRTAQVITYFPGASPERVELLVTDKLEKAIQELPELDFVNSESRTGVSIISANVKESYTELRPIWDKLRRKVEGVQSSLPSEAQTPIINDEFGDVFGIVLGLTAEGYSYREMKEVADFVKDDLLRLSESAKVDIFGEQEERIFIEYNNAQLAELGISPGQLSDQLASRNIVIPGGSINLGSEKIALEPTGNFETIDDIRKTIIQIPGSDRVHYLSDLVTVSRSYVDPAQSKVSLTGERGLSIAVAMREGGNNILLGQQVTESLERFNSIYPIGVEFELISFLPKDVEAKVDDFSSNLIQAVLIVTIVMLFSLGLRTGLIVAVLIPSSMVFGILVMSVFNIGIDQISLAALIIALGMLVDNGIVMSESIMVQMENGKKPIDAAVESADELKVPLLTSSLTTAAAFLPIFLAESSTGEYTASLFKVVTITLLCSWILSMTVIPMLCVYFMKVKKQQQSFDTPIYSTYRSALYGLIRFRWLTVGVTVCLFVVAIWAINFVPKIFFPPSDRAFFKMEIEMPMGTTIETTESISQQIERYIADELQIKEAGQAGVINWVNYIGNGGPRFLLTHSPKPSSSNYALFVINLTSQHEIDQVMEQLEAYTFNNFPDLLVKLRKIENGAPIANPVEVRIKGSDSTKIFAIVDQVKQQMAMVSGLKAISDNWGLPIKKLQVDIDQTRARRAGVSSKDIAISLQTGLSGLELTQYRDGDLVIPVTMRTNAADRQDIGKLEALAVYSQASGSSVPLTQVADIKVIWEPAKILRRDRLKTVTVGAQIDSSVTAMQALEQLVPWLEQEQQKWPLGYSFELGGEFESSGKANQSIADKLPIAGFIIILLLVAQFNSMRKSLIILLTIPLGVIGVVAGLLIGQSFFGFMTLLGIISLAGIVINNAIVLLERIKIEQEQLPSDPARAIVEAAQKRMRPIILTTATTIFGLIPLYLGGGEFWEPMAISIIGGLLFSTVFTLAVIPVVYAILFNIKHKPA
ncbi:efflux RND transporter permease subunit [Psychrobium sp. 1_MG-2023]|uniref:efflux RND transporter permease subunit n=1 Tax=Psychrobium sp. 1_MG-2023 TaxID=3062624 RepID=UPI000C32389F|nr:efflux RND transporter permease subunit [Psychrobium sp. 1_MG-2023]MDP2560665.1 efflux RND transporter permease subunit [Psychrobium sp. 1_MG-2023]PKF56561.1 AcrB/AcrD/AcrF family protein [Alteromonadales bacterium alter-6D02]